MSMRLLIVRLGAMGDILHALPAVASLKSAFPSCRLVWVVEPRWTVLLEGNPYVDEVCPVDRRNPAGALRALMRLRAGRFDLAVDFQGLIKSAIVARLSGAKQVLGFHPSQLRERAAGWLYHRTARTDSVHVVEKNLDLALAAGARERVIDFPVPPGRAEGELPEGPFVLACPLAGWPAKQWPLEHYETLAGLLHKEFGIPMVLNGPPRAASIFPAVAGALPHYSGVDGLIWATRRAAAVVGVDSGPTHLAAALGKPGVAIYGPTDPGRNGPYGGSMQVLRHPRATTSYRRRTATDESMFRITPQDVVERLRPVLHAAAGAQQREEE